MATGQIQVVRDEGKRLKATVEAKQPEWVAALEGTGMSAPQFVAGLYQAVRANPRLLEAGTDELLKAAGRALAYGLDMSGVTGESWPVGPLLRKGVKTVELWLGIKGVIKLAYRSGFVRLIRPEVVREGDDFAVDPMSIDRPISHTPRGGAGMPIAWYALVILESGGVLYGVTWADELGRLRDQARARLGNGFDRSPWATHPEEMAQVQALRRALKWAPKSVQDLSRLAEERPAIVSQRTPALAAPADAFDPETLALEVEAETVDAAPTPATAPAPAPAAPESPAGQDGAAACVCPGCGAEVAADLALEVLAKGTCPACPK